MKKVLGGLMIVLGVALLGWVGYTFVAPQPAGPGGATQQNPIPALIFAAGLLFVGVMWVRGKTAG